MNNALGASLAAEGSPKSYKEKLAEKRAAEAEAGLVNGEAPAPVEEEAAPAPPPKPLNPDEERMEKFRAALADIQEERENLLKSQEYNMKVKRQPSSGSKNSKDGDGEGADGVNGSGKKSADNSQPTSEQKKSGGAGDLDDLDEEGLFDDDDDDGDSLSDPEGIGNIDDDDDELKLGENGEMSAEPATLRRLR